MFAKEAITVFAVRVSLWSKGVELLVFRVQSMKRCVCDEGVGGDGRVVRRCSEDEGWGVEVASEAVVGEGGRRGDVHGGLGGSCQGGLALGGRSGYEGQAGDLGAGACVFGSVQGVVCVCACVRGVLCVCSCVSGVALGRLRVGVVVMCACVFFCQRGARGSASESRFREIQIEAVAALCNKEGACV